MNLIDIGLGYRRDLVDELTSISEQKPAFLELVPENWMGLGGYWRKKLREAAEQYSFVSHGLSLSIGSPDPVDIVFVNKVKQFLDEFNINIYSDHLTFASTNNAHLYDLLPIPFREDAIKHVVGKIKTVQDIIERPLVLENASYYTEIGAEMDEATFISEIVKRSGCELLLDVNNVYVNAFNHNYDPKEFINKMPLDKVSYIHMAGHKKVSDDLIIDTHGAPIIDPVFDLFDYTMQMMNKRVPILLERDFNIPEMSELQNEMVQLQTIVNKHWQVKTSLS